MYYVTSLDLHKCVRVFMETKLRITFFYLFLKQHILHVTVYTFNVCSCVFKQNRAKNVA